MAMLLYGRRRCLGTVLDPHDPVQYQWRSFEEVRGEVRAFAQGLQHLSGIRAGNVVGLLASACVEWLTSDVACLIKGFISTPMHRSTSSRQLASVAKRCGMRVLVASVHVKSVIWEVREELAQYGLQWIVWLSDAEAAYPFSTPPPQGTLKDEGGVHIREGIADISLFRSIPTMDVQIHFYF